MVSPTRTADLRQLGQQEVSGQIDLSFPYPRFSVAERDRRWTLVREQMRQAGVDVLVGCNSPGHWNHWQGDVRYMTQMGGHDVDAAFVFPLEGEPTGFAINEMYWGLAAPFWLRDLRPCHWFWGQAIGERLREIGRDDLTIAITGLDGILRAPEGVAAWGTVEKIKQLMPRAKIVGGSDICTQPRYRKSQEELAFLQKSVDLCEKAVQAMAATARPGVKESQVYAAMIAAMIADGGEIPTMLTWLSGPWGNLSRRLTLATERVMAKGDAIINEIEARYAGYCSQQEQPLFLGPVPADVVELFKWQDEVFHTALDALQPGRPFQTVIDAVRKLDASTDKFVLKLTLHGRGLGDDWPLIVDDVVRGSTGDLSRLEIEPNTAFVVKPNVRPAGTTYRGERITWSDTVVVTDKGAKRLGTRPVRALSVEC